MTQLTVFLQSIRRLVFYTSPDNKFKSERLLQPFVSDESVSRRPSSSTEGDHHSGSRRSRVWFVWIKKMRTPVFSCLLLATTFLLVNGKKLTKESLKELAGSEFNLFVNFHSPR